MSDGTPSARYKRDSLSLIHGAISHWHASPQTRQHRGGHRCISFELYFRFSHLQECSSYASKRSKDLSRGSKGEASLISCISSRWLLASLQGQATLRSDWRIIKRYNDTGNVPEAQPLLGWGGVGKKIAARYQTQNMEDIQI